MPLFVYDNKISIHILLWIFVLNPNADVCVLNPIFMSSQIIMIVKSHKDQI